MDDTDLSESREEPEERSSQIVVANQALPNRLPLVPLRERPMFPRTVAPFVVDRPEILQLINDVVEARGRMVGAVLRRSSAAEDVEGVAPSDGLHAVGVVAQILKTEIDSATGQRRMLLGALERFEIVRVVAREPYVVADVRYLIEPQTEVSDEIKAYALSVINAVKDLVKLNPLFKEELNLLIAQGPIAEPSRLADYAAYLTSASGAELQAVLETLELRVRLERVLALLDKELDISKLEVKIRQQIDERVSKQQRDFFLREQLKSIKRELGLEKDDKDAELERFRERLEVRKPSDEARARIDEELEKLQALEPTSPEYSVTRNYLDWLTTLPWGIASEADVTLEGARAVLDADHYGLDDVKARIVEFVAAGLLRDNFGGSILALVGPPGVGKTSIGRSIARALGREFYRFSLGGMQDEAEIKGHRRTYIGAMPGKFLQALRVCRTDNPVIMLDEIDKIGSSYRGDPASALLEALDPEQNRGFLDHYLDVRYDLSNVLFVATANQLDTIPPPLLDRMELIKLSGYILEEKVEIAEKYLLPKETANLRLRPHQVRLTRPVLRELIDGYAREAGVRSLEQLIRRLFRQSAVRIVEDPTVRIKIGPQQLRELLGKRRFDNEPAARRTRPGVVMGLAWTSLGGDTLFIEVAAVRTRRRGLKQTGQLGKVMIESSEIAYTYVRALCGQTPQAAKFFDEHQLHIHVPAGATPKDGPSAGITMASALYSLANDRAIQRGFAMTGELNLSGDVLPVGGIKEKVIAAKRARVKHVILPAANEADFESLPDHIRKGLEVHFVRAFLDVVELCLS